MLYHSDILKDPSLTANLNKQWEKYGPILLDLKETSCKDPVDMANRIRDYYLGKKKFGEESSAEFVEVSLATHRPRLIDLSPEEEEDK